MLRNPNPVSVPRHLWSVFCSRGGQIEYSPVLLRLASPVAGDGTVLTQHCAAQVYSGHLGSHLRHVHAMTESRQTTDQVRSGQQAKTAYNIAL